MQEVPEEHLNESGLKGGQPRGHGGSAVYGQGGGALMWSIVVHWVHRLWDILGGAGQGEPRPVFCWGPPCLSYKAI